MNRNELLNAALVGLRLQGQKISDSIAEVEAELRGSSRPAFIGKPMLIRSTRKKMSAEGRKKIAEGQRRRWAAFHKAQKTA